MNPKLLLSARTRSCVIYQNNDETWEVHKWNGNRLESVMYCTKKTGTKLYRRMRSRRGGKDDKLVLTMVAMEANNRTPGW